MFQLERSAFQLSKTVSFAFNGQNLDTFFSRAPEVDLSFPPRTAQCLILFTDAVVPRAVPSYRHENLTGAVVTCHT